MFICDSGAQQHAVVNGQGEGNQRDRGADPVDWVGVKRRTARWLGRKRRGRKTSEEVIEVLAEPRQREVCSPERDRLSRRYNKASFGTREGRRTPGEWVVRPPRTGDGSQETGMQGGDCVSGAEEEQLGGTCRDVGSGTRHFWTASAAPGSPMAPRSRHVAVLDW